MHNVAQRKPYVGVSGFMTPGEVDVALDVFPACDRQLMVGVLASSKSLNGIPTRWARRYPKPEDIAEIFSNSPRALNLVHYATGGEEDVSRLSDAFATAIGYGGPTCHGIQVNAVWPSPLALMSVRDRRPDLRVVLQLGPRAMAADFFGEDMVSTLAAYDGAVTDVLIDASGGLGKLMDEGLARRVSVACIRALTNVSVGIAGGLDASTVRKFSGFIRAGFSCDAEGRLRDDADSGGNLDLVKVAAYLAAAATP